MEEIRPSFGAVAKELQDFIYNEIDVITESDWFAERLDNKVAIAVGEKETPLRVDVNYVVQRLEEIVNSDHTDAVEFLEELKENLDNHKGKKNGLDSIRKAN